MNNDECCECALARLSVAALAIDALLVVIASVILSDHIPSEISKLFGYLDTSYDFLSFIMAFFFVTIVYLFVTEIILGGLTIGRLCCGLKIKDSTSNSPPSMLYRFRRLSEILIKMGFTSLHLKKVPAHNKRLNGALCSDWVDFDLTTLSTQTKLPREKSKPVSTRVKGAFLKNLSDPSSSKVVNLQSGRLYKSKGIFYIGRTSERSDMVLSSDKTVSKTHCRIVKRDTGFILADGENRSKSSTGGTFLNGKELEASKIHPLKHGDKINIGQSEIQFLLK